MYLHLVGITLHAKVTNGNMHNKVQRLSRKGVHSSEWKWRVSDKKVAIMEALTPYKEKLMMAYVKENTCNCLRGQLMLPNTPVLQGYGSYSGCNCGTTTTTTPSTGA